MLDDQITLLFVALSGVIVTFKAEDISPTTIAKGSGVVIKIDSTGIAAALTVTIQVFVIAPFFPITVALILTVPRLTPFTTPSATVAIFSSLEAQAIVLFVAFAGDTDTFKVAVSF